MILAADTSRATPVTPQGFAESFGVPREIEAVVQEFRTCEFTTLARDGTPITWPVAPFFQSKARRFLISTSIGLPQKALNVRREPRVAMLFSDPTASGIAAPPAVLIQGNAEAPDELMRSVEGLEELAIRVLRRQPVGMTFGGNPLIRPFLGWYCMRVPIYVYPRHIRWWPRGDFAAAPREVVL